MKISVILAHPNKESFNHAIAKTTVRGAHIELGNELLKVNLRDRSRFKIVYESDGGKFKIYELVKIKNFKKFNIKLKQIILNTNMVSLNFTLKHTNL